MEREIQIRHLVAGIIATSVTTDDTEGVWVAAQLIDAFVNNLFLAAARHAGEAGCEQCSALVSRFASAKNSSDEDALDEVINELYSHMSLESDIAGDLDWLGGNT